MREPQDVCRPRTQMLSLMAMGTPASVASELFGAASNSSARRSAPARSISRKALSVSLSFNAASSADSATAREVTLRPAMLDLIDSMLCSEIFIKRLSIVRSQLSVVLSGADVERFIFRYQLTEHEQRTTDD